MDIIELGNQLEKMFPNDEYLKELSALADNMAQIRSTRKAYDYDKIKDHLCERIKLKSADALLVGKRQIALIEFKTGFAEDTDYTCDDDRLKKEQLRLSIRLKACESLIMFEKIICDGQPVGFDKVFIIVINSQDDPKGARSNVIGRLSKTNKSYSEKARIQKELLEHSLLLYRKNTFGKQIMYNRIMVMYDTEFDSEIEKCL